MSNSLKTFFTKPPILFPLAALFHLVLFIAAVVTLYPTPLSQRDWLAPLASLSFTIAAFLICTMRKWTAMSYVGLSIACLALMYFGGYDSPARIFGQALFPLNLILSFFILLLYKRFR
ncbi:hypothetical protein [Rurimicrobium arvi]|uniref:Uncharacterized protein n=1 Tax=Rurimicrobium arvi TaxID=2049916 RepID=A0ABP8MEA9_9BACT